MKMINFPFKFGRPRELTVLEQVFCMVWLATNFNLHELRQRQLVIEQQFQSAVENESSEHAFQNLEAMQANTDAAVAYLTFPTLDTWLAYIRK